jgi:hypothetical protein
VLDPSTVKLAVCLPTHDSRTDMDFQSSLQNSINELVDLGIEVKVFVTAGGSNVGKAREKVLWNAYHAGATHFFFVDSDMSWDDARLPLDLICTGHEFVAVAGFTKSDTPLPCFNKLADEPRFSAKTMFLEVRDVGFAFVVLHRSAIDAMIAANPDTKYDTGPGGRDEYALFMEFIDRDRMPEGERLSEDFAFCRRWRRTGGRIFIDHNARLGHIGRKVYTGVVSEHFSIKPAAPALESVPALAAE